VFLCRIAYSHVVHAFQFSPLPRSSTKQNRFHLRLAQQGTDKQQKKNITSSRQTRSQNSNRRSRSIQTVRRKDSIFKKTPNEQHSERRNTFTRGGNRTSSTFDIDKHFAEKLSEMVKRNRDGMNLTQSYCDSVLGLCVATNEWDSVLEVMEVMKDQNITQQRSSYKACLQSCFECGNGEAAEEILNAMIAAQYRPDPIDISLVVVAMCKQSNRKDENRWWKRALSLLMTRKIEHAPEGKVVPVEAYDAVLSCMVKSKNWRDAVRLIRSMEKGVQMDPPLHPVPSLSTYRLVIETCAAANQAEQAFQALMSVIQQGPTPTSYTFELVISALSKKLQWRRALQLLDMMNEMDVRASVRTYNLIISACAKSGELRAAQNLLRKMRKDGVKPDIFSFNSVLTACASSSRWKDALTVLDQCHREPGVEPDIISYTNAIRACTRGGKFSRALAIFESLQDRKLRLDNYAYTAIIDACAKGRMWRRALELLDEMKENEIEPNAVTYSVAITACGNGGQWQKSLELLDEMKEKGMTVNLFSFNAAITALAKASKRSAKRSTRESSSLRASTSKEETFDFDEQQLWTKALDLLERMKNEGLEPDGFSYSAAISCCGSGGRWKEALAIIKEMQSGGPKLRPNKIAYTAAISACGKSGRHQEALELFTDMKEQGLQPDQVAYNAVFSALRVAKMPQQSLQLWQEVIGKSNNKPRKIASARADSAVSPDIITVTNVIASLARSDDEVMMKSVDDVFEEAVKREIILGKDTLDSEYDIDLHGMTFPVARAAVRYVLKRIKNSNSEGKEFEDISFITGTGRTETPRAGVDSFATQLANDDEERQVTSLRDYVQEILRTDFEPPIKSTVPKLGQGTVVVDKNTLKLLKGHRT